MITTSPTPFIIAIDGHAASGKGTLARRLAAAWDCAFMDTGSLYRLAALRLLDSGGDPADVQAAVRAAEDLRDTYSPAESDNPAIRQDTVGQAASKISAIPEVRAALTALQRTFAINPPALADGKAARGAVLDGRDIGTVICPDAPVKLYVTAKTEIRALRRHKELQSSGIPVTYDAVLADMRERDARDMERATAPLKPAPDAFILDSSDLDPQQVFEMAQAHIHTILPKQ